MRDAMTAAGVPLIPGTVVWYGGSLLLRAAAFGWLVFAGVGLLLAGHGDQSPWAPVAFAGLGAGCWAAGHVLHRARRGWWATPIAAPAFFPRTSGRHLWARRAPSGVFVRAAALTFIQGQWGASDLIDDRHREDGKASRE